MTEYAIIISFLLSILVVGILFYFYRKWLIKNTDEDEVEKMTRKEILEKTIDFDDAINRIVRLEKENAELKSGCGMCYRKDKDQLTYAKELLAKWVELFKPKGGNIPPTPIQVVTEQFLNENSTYERIQKAKYNYTN